MYSVTVMNLKTKTQFVKEFASIFLAKKFVNKCKYSKTVRVVETSGFW